MKHTQNGKRSGNGKGAVLLGTLDIEVQHAIAGMIDKQSTMAIDWHNWLSSTADRAAANARDGKTPKIRKDWQKRLAAIERAQELVGAALTHAMRTVGEGAADVIEAEFQDGYALKFADELRNYEPCDFPE